MILNSASSKESIQDILKNKARWLDCRYTTVQKYTTDILLFNKNLNSSNGLSFKNVLVRDFSVIFLGLGFSDYCGSLFTMQNNCSTPTCTYLVYLP